MLYADILIHSFSYLTIDEVSRCRLVCQKWYKASKTAARNTVAKELQTYRDWYFDCQGVTKLDKEGNDTFEVYKSPTWTDMATEFALLSSFNFSSVHPSHTDLSRMLYAALSVRYNGMVTVFGVMHSIYWYSSDSRYPFTMWTIRKWLRDDAEMEMRGMTPISEVFFSRLAQCLSTDCLWYLIHVMHYDENIENVRQDVDWSNDIQPELDWMNSI